MGRQRGLQRVGDGGGVPGDATEAATVTVVAGCGGTLRRKTAEILAGGVDEPPLRHRGLPGPTTDGWSERGLEGVRRK